MQMGKQENERKGGGGIITKDVYSCKVLAGKRSLTERRDALQLFKDGSIRILIATDIADRGIDIAKLPFVINMTLPDDHNGESKRTYVHRVGWVGRAERMGLAVSLVSCVGFVGRVRSLLVMIVGCMKMKEIANGTMNQNYGPTLNNS
mmetsp:Transcript_20994/g.30911  ORF Transcript_20994/g.30911 Transcript_20994/m.30911 type:complete len:148 (-) Transcript_20994:253-696(-)